MTTAEMDIGELQTIFTSDHTVQENAVYVGEMHEVEDFGSRIGLRLIAQVIAQIGQQPLDEIGLLSL
jgi:hypothetical protein